MDKLPPEKLQEYDAFPLAHRAGLIHSIAEEDLSIETATIIDVTFLGLFPKSLLEVLQKYKNGLKQDAQPEFDFLIRGLVSAVIYRAITIQHIFQYLLVAIKLQIETDCQKRQEALSTNDEKEPELCSSIHSSSATSTPTAGSNDSTPRKLRYANKCQFLLAKGILRAPVPCAKGRNICPGCILESARQRKTAMVENDIIQAKTSNLILAPMLNYITTPVSIKELRSNLQYLPTLQPNRRDDSIFGVIRYLANSLGFRLSNATAESIDEAMNLLQVKKKWRQATFSCKCRDILNNEQRDNKDRTFCNTCSFIISHHNSPSKTCSGCLQQDSWGSVGSFCLACQFATIIYRNRFHTRYSNYIEKWIPTLATESEDDTFDPHIHRHRSTHQTRTRASCKDLPRLRQELLKNSFEEIRLRSSLAESLCVIENITMLQRDIRHTTGNKHSINSLQSASNASLTTTQDEIFPPREGKSLKQMLPSDPTKLSNTGPSTHDTTIRTPLAPIELNSITSDAASAISRRKQKNRNCTATAKAKKSMQHSETRNIL